MRFLTWPRRSGKTTAVEDARNHPNDKEMPLSDHEPTVSRQTTPDTDTNRFTNALEGTTMTINNRQIALLSAALTSEAEDVLDYAENFLGFLEGESTTVAGEPAEQEEPQFLDALDTILRARQQEFGALAVTYIEEQASALEGYVVSEGVTTAVNFLDRGVSSLAPSTVATLRNDLVSLVATPPTEASTRSVVSERTGAEIITLLQSYERRYGAPVRPLIARAEAIRNTPLESAKRQAVEALRLSREISLYPTQVEALIRDIRML